MMDGKIAKRLIKNNIDVALNVISAHVKEEGMLKEFKVFKKLIQGV